MSVVAMARIVSGFFLFHSLQTHLRERSLHDLLNCRSASSCSPLSSLLLDSFFLLVNAIVRYFHIQSLLEGSPVLALSFASESESVRSLITKHRQAVTSCVFTFLFRCVGLSINIIIVMIVPVAVVTLALT
jgi:hypothetical protein